MNYDRLDVPLIDYSQTMKQCKKTTPDFVEGVEPTKATKKREGKPGVPQIGFRTKDMVTINSAKSLLQDITLSGDYKFDSYDKYDNTCYVLDEKSDMTYNILLTDIKLKEEL